MVNAQGLKIKKGPPFSMKANKSPKHLLLSEMLDSTTKQSKYISHSYQSEIDVKYTKINMGKILALISLHIFCW